jgi:hypothetical protein
MRLLIYILTFLIGVAAAGGYPLDANAPCGGNFAQTERQTPSQVKK